MKVTKIVNDKMMYCQELFLIFRKMCIIMNVCQLKYNISLREQFIRVMHESGNR